MNSEPELINQEDEELTCLACGSVFGPDGQIVDRYIEKEAQKTILPKGVDKP